MLLSVAGYLHTDSARRLLRTLRVQQEARMSPDLAWQRFLDVLTGQRPSADCPTLEDLATEHAMDDFEELIYDLIKGALDAGHSYDEIIESLRQIAEDLTQAHLKGE